MWIYIYTQHGRNRHNEAYFGLDSDWQSHLANLVLDGFVVHVERIDTM